MRHFEYLGNRPALDIPQTVTTEEGALITMHYLQCRT